MRFKHYISIACILLFALLLTACGSELEPPNLTEDPSEQLLMPVTPIEPADAAIVLDIQEPVDSPTPYSIDVEFIDDEIEIEVQYISQDVLQQDELPLSTDYIEDLIVHFLDVGQADSTLIQLPNGQTMLIDGGNSSDADNIINYIRSLGITIIDYLVATHPHADHIGGLPTIIDAFEIISIYMPYASNNTQTFERLLNSIENNGLVVDTTKEGVTILFEQELGIDIIAPVRDDYQDLNNFSAVIKLTYKNTSFIFMGDAESLSESHITADVSSDVLKVGHHGSRTSTSAAFLDKVNPTFAVISVGSSNSYGHPTDEVLSRLNNAGIYVFRTDLQGTIVFSSDGENIIVDTTPTEYQAPEPPPAETIAANDADINSTGSEQESTDASTTNNTGESNDPTVYRTRTGQRYHNDGCRHLSRSKIETTLSAAKSLGLTACGTCRPPS